MPAAVHRGRCTAAPPAPRRRCTRHGAPYRRWQSPGSRARHASSCPRQTRSMGHLGPGCRGTATRTSTVTGPLCGETSGAAHQDGRRRPNDVPEERMARSLQERLGHAAGQASDALTGAARAWAGAVAQLTRALSDPVTMVEGAFDVAEEVL